MCIKSHPLYLYTYVKELFIIAFIVIFIAYKYQYKKIMYAAIGFVLVVLGFFRNNLGPIEKNAHLFLSPSSSKIVKIRLTDLFTVVSTYLSPLDNHFMIAPCDCLVIDKIYKPQRKYDSECMRHVMKTSAGEKFYLDQIVSKPLHWGWIPSLLYDRCVSFVKVGDRLKQGERFGLIRFGSNMEYGLPLSYGLNHTVGDKVKMGEPL